MGLMPDRVGRGRGRRIKETAEAADSPSTFCPVPQKPVTSPACIGAIEEILKNIS